MAKIIISFALIFVFCVMLALSDNVLFDLFEEDKAKDWSYIIGAPFLIYISLGLIYDKWKNNYKSNKDRIKTSFKYAWKGIFGFVFFYIFCIAPIVAAIIFLINSFIGPQETVTIKGQVVDISSFVSARGGKCQLEIQTKDEIIELETNLPVTNKYQVGDYFEEQLQKGCFGLLFKKKP